MRELIHVPLIHSIQYSQYEDKLTSDSSDVNFQSYTALSSEFWSLTNSLVKRMTYPRVRVFHDGYFGETMSIKGATQVERVLTPVFGELATRGGIVPDLEPIYILAENCDEVIMQKLEDRALLRITLMNMYQENQTRVFFASQVNSIPEHEDIPDEVFKPYQDKLRAIFHQRATVVDQRDQGIRLVINENLEDSSKETGILFMGGEHNAHLGLKPDIKVTPLDRNHSQLAAAGVSFIRQQRDEVLFLS